MDTVTIQVEEVIRETDLALLFLIDDDEVWMPKSVITDGDEIEVGACEIEIEVAEWFAKQEGLV